MSTAEPPRMSAAEEPDPVPAVRFEIESDRGAILSSWLRSYQQQRPHEIDHVRRGVYFEEHDEALKRILARPTTVTMVLPSPAGDEHISSWLCGEIRPSELIVHWGYSFDFARGRNFFRYLLHCLLSQRGDRALIYTHRTKRMHKFAEALGATFNPYRIFE